MQYPFLKGRSMLTTQSRQGDGPRQGTARESRSDAAARWENEGGATVSAPAAPPVVGHQPGWDLSTPRQNVALDARQDDLMAIASPDGHPPTHRLRRLEWWWLAIGVAVVGVIGLGWAALRGVDSATVIGGSGLLFVLLAAASPVWGAALLRGREERLARRRARAELGAGNGRRSPPQAGPV